MRLLAEYLSTKPKHIIKSFPIGKDVETIKEFLKNNELKECTDYSVISSTDIKAIFNYFDGNEASYMCNEYGKDHYYFRIFNGGKISKNNPIFLMYVHNTFEMYGIQDKIRDYYNFNWSRERFLDELNKRFEWK